MFTYITIIGIVLLSIFELEDKRQTAIFRLLLAVFMFACALLLIDFVDYSNDIQRYFDSLNSIKGFGLVKSISLLRYEFGFSIYLWSLSWLVSDIALFIVINFSLIVFITLFSFRKHISKTDVTLVLFGLLAFFYYINFATNIVRQGFAFAILLSAIIALYENKYGKSLLIFLIASSFHISSCIFIPLFLVKRFKISLKNLLIMYGLTLLITFSGVNVHIVKYFPRNLGLISELFFRYSSDGFIGLYGSSTRIDFIIFTTIWLVFSLVVSNYVKSTFYDWIVRTYLVFSIIYTLLSFMSFSDRIAGYSWGLIPFLIVFPATTVIGRRKVYFSLLATVVLVILSVYFDLLSYY